MSAKTRDPVGTQLLRRLEAKAMAGSLNSLTHAERVVIKVMALNALDMAHEDTPADIYFRGWNHLAAELGYAGEEQTPAARSAVQRAVRGLTDKGLIKTEGRLGGRASPTVYRLTY